MQVNFNTYKKGANGGSQSCQEIRKCSLSLLRPVLIKVDNLHVLWRKLRGRIRQVRGLIPDDGSNPGVALSPELPAACPDLSHNMLYATSPHIS